ncbi:hypothetical protein AYO44_05235 [Planctomycetaceae bacterium SCGC AG-212-F19]|nr:hypothetical protein AYO44_05235 [Planctomycetaceae bacterium SCGC AG-212-F19]
MFFPWVGLFEQIRLANVYVHYDDVQMPQGRSFMSRVQIKTSDGVKWLTAPVKHSGRLIREVCLDDEQGWRERHLKCLHYSFAKAPHRRDMYELAKAVYESTTTSLADFNRLAIERIAGYFGITPTFVRSSDINGCGNSSEKLLDVILKLSADTYITGHGARNYLDHELFEQHGIRVEYMDYRRVPYPQLHGEFTPHVSILDLIANCGKVGREVIASGTVYWKDFLQR